MVKSRMDRAKQISAMNERLRRDAIRILRAALSPMVGNLEQVEADARLPKGEAPFYLHMATQLGADSMRREGADKAGAGTTLNVLIMGQAPSNEAWLEAVRQSQQKVIEAVEAKEPAK